MDKLREGARRLGIQLTGKQLAQFDAYAQAIIEWNTRFNLTAIAEPEQIEVRHFLDSLACLKLLQTWSASQGASKTPTWRVIDVGSGAGLPGIPLKIVCPWLAMVLLDSTAKKVQFLKHVIALLGLQEITALHGRAEELAREPQHREKYDVVLARAVAPLPTLVEYLLPLTRCGGVVVALKGSAGAAEAMAADEAIRVLGGELASVTEVEVPFLAETRTVILIHKRYVTREAYPRGQGLPRKRPLGVKSISSSG